MHMCSRNRILDLQFDNRTVMTKQVTLRFGLVMRSRGIFRFQRRPNNHNYLVGLRGAGQSEFDCKEYIIQDSVA